MAEQVLLLTDRRSGADIHFKLDMRALLIMAAQSDRVEDLVRKKMKATMGKAGREVIRLARAIHKFRARSGEADRAIVYAYDEEEVQGVVSLDEEIAPYIRFLHEGSGLYGPHHKAFDIFPKNKKMLRFATSPGTAMWRPDPYGRFHEGGFTYAFGVTNPGIKKDQFLYEAADQAKARIQELFDSAVNDLAKQLEQQMGGAG